MLTLKIRLFNLCKTFEQNISTCIFVQKKFKTLIETMIANYLAHKFSLWYPVTFISDWWILWANLMNGQCIINTWFNHHLQHQLWDGGHCGLYRLRGQRSKGLFINPLHISRFKWFSKMNLYIMFHFSLYLEKNYWLWNYYL